MASSLNEHSLEKKLATVTNTQDSIQTLSLWILHHKVHHQKIVEIWFKVLKKVKINQRLTLFYVANDVIQHSKRKGLNVFLDSFSEILKEATVIVRDDSIKNSVTRIFNIWDERSVYGSDLISELQAILDNTKAETIIKTKMIAEFKQPKARPKRSKARKPVESTPVSDEPSTSSSIASPQLSIENYNPQKFFDTLISFRTFENEVELKRRQLSTLRLDASSTEALKHLKDRAHGNKFSKEFEEATVKLDDYVKCQEKEILDRKNLLELLEQTHLYYSSQYGEAKIVANAYKNFGNRINNLKKKLDELKKTLPDPISPVPSPSADAPSPGDTPPDDSFRDNIEAIDMELSDDEGSSGNIVATEPLKPPVINSSVVKPIIASSNPIIPFDAESIKSALVNSNYGDKAKVISSAFTDKPISPKLLNMEAYSPAGSVDSAPSPEGSPIGFSPTRTDSSEIQLPMVTSKSIKNDSSPKKLSSASSPQTADPEPRSSLDQETSSLDSRLSSLLQNLSSLPMGLQNSFLGNVSPTPVQSPPTPPFAASKPAFEIESKSPPSNFVQPSSSTNSSEVAGGTPLKDEGNTTPLQDEEIEQLELPENPIEFLTRIISKSHMQGGLDFLENLSSLTSKIKSSLDSEMPVRPNDPVKETQSNYPAAISTPISETQASFSTAHKPGVNSQPSLDYPDSLDIDYPDSLDYPDSWKPESSNTPVVTTHYSSPLWSSSINSGTPQITSSLHANSLSSVLSNQINSGQLLKSAMNSVLPPSIISELNSGSSSSTASPLNSGMTTLSTSQNLNARTSVSSLNIDQLSSDSSPESHSPQMAVLSSPSKQPISLISTPLSQKILPIIPPVLPKPIITTSPISRPPFRLIDMDFRQAASKKQNQNIVELVHNDAQVDFALDTIDDISWSPFSSKKNDESSAELSYEAREPQPPAFRPPALPLRNLISHEIPNNQNEFLQKLKEKTASLNFPATFPQVSSFAKPTDNASHLPPTPPPPPPLPSSSHLQSIASNLKTLVPYNNNSDQDSDKSSAEEESIPSQTITNPVSSPDEGERTPKKKIEETHNSPTSDNFESMQPQKIETTLGLRMKREQQYDWERPNNFYKWSPGDRPQWSGSQQYDPYKYGGYDKNYERDRQYDLYERDQFPRRGQYPRRPARNPFVVRNPNKRPRPYPPHY